MPKGSSAPIKMYGPGKTPAISASTASTAWYVAGSSGSSHALDFRSNSSTLRPLFSSGRIWISALAWPGVLIKGMSVMKRSSA